MSKIDGYTIGNSFMTVIVDGTVNTVPRDSRIWQQCVDAVRHKDADKLVQLLTTTNTLPKEISDHEVEIVDDEVFFMGRKITGKLAERIVELRDMGLDPLPYSRFLSHLKRNPNSNSVEQLYEFLDRYSFGITEDGHFLAYKVVDKELRDKHTGSIFNSPGVRVEMPREQVSTDVNEACGPGLHVGAWEYSGINGAHFQHGDRVVMVKVNPADVCRVPRDESYRKIAVCAYEVVKEITQPVNELEETEKVLDWSDWMVFITTESAHGNDAPNKICMVPTFEEVVRDADVVDVKLFYNKDDGLHFYTGDGFQVLPDGDIMLDSIYGIKRFKLNKIETMMFRVGNFE